MNKSLLSFVCTAAAAVNILAMNVYAAGEEKLTLNENIVISDVSGKIFIHMQNKGTLDVTLDKTEPEGIFRYYEAALENPEDKEKVFLMDLSCCEYLVDSKTYASYYTLNFNVPSDKNAGGEQTITIKDPDFDSITGSEYHYYITFKSSDKSGCDLISKKEETTKDGTFISRQYIEISQAALLGDVDGNGAIDLMDATSVLEIYAKSAAGIAIDNFTDEQKKAADANFDGAVDLLDATYILETYAKNAAGLK